MSLTSIYLCIYPSPGSNTFPLYSGPWEVLAELEFGRLEGNLPSGIGVNLR